MTGATGPTGPAGAAAATIPFSFSSYGSQLSTNASGDPQTIAFTGFGSSDHISAIYLQEGEWASGTIVIDDEMFMGNMFVMPRTATLQNLYVLASSKYSTFFQPGVLIYPFACLAIATADTLALTVLQESIVYTEPYSGGVEYPKHTIRRGSKTGLNVPIPQGALTAIIVGVRAENATDEQYGSFTISGGLYLE